MAKTTPLHWRAIRTIYASYTRVEENDDFERGARETHRPTTAAAEQALAVGERQIVTEVASHASAFEQSLREDRRQNDRALARLEARLDDNAKRRERYESEFSREIFAIENRHGAESVAYKDAEEAFIRSLEFYDEIRTELHRSPIEKLELSKYAIALGLALLIETPLNNISVQFMANIYYWLDWTVALSLSFIFLFLVHLLGFNFHRGLGTAPTKTRVMHFVLAAVLFAIIAATVVLLAYMRDQALQMLTSGMPGFTLGIKEAGAAALKAAREGQPWRLSPEALGIVAFNTLVVVVMSAMAFLRTDPDARFEQAYESMKRDERRFRTIRLKREKLLANANRINDDRVTTLDRLEASLQRDRAMALDEIDWTEKQVRAGLHSMACTRDRRIAAYRRGATSTAGAFPKLPAESPPAATAGTSDETPSTAAEQRLESTPGSGVEEPP